MKKKKNTQISHNNLPNQIGKETRESEKIKDFEKISENLLQLIPKEDTEASLKMVHFLIQHKHEFPTLGQEMSESLKAERKNRETLFDAISGGLGRIILGYNSREGWKVAIVGLYTLAAIGAGGWLLYQREYNLGVALIASPFIVTLIGKMFGK